MMTSSRRRDGALEQERVRAELHDRPLTIAAIEIKLHDDQLGLEAARRARRAVARSLETELRVTDIVQCRRCGRFGAILPETTAGAARDVLESALMSARQATFADHEVRGRRSVARRPTGLFAVSANLAGRGSGRSDAEVAIALPAVETAGAPALLWLIEAV
ncbi:MAG: hypothetical protein R2731_16925 [Nocardioides sp.]